jgi:chromosome segregation ATPase
LDGRSCSFTAANELGKSTFLAGLLATLFGPPPVRARLQLFQERFRSWNKPPWFWGELEFAVSDERWRVRRDFESGDVKVWRLASDGFAELRFEERVKPGRKPNEPDPYARLLEDWLGIGDRELYEAMFVVSQESSLATGWQIDSRIAERVYGPAVKRLHDKLRELFEQFREITRNTRDAQVALAGQGERNGRNDGRLDLVIARIAEREGQLTAARERTRVVTELRARLTELDARCTALGADVDQTTRSLEHWRAWQDLEARLRPAVESYERLRALNERCQQVARPLAELRARLAGDLAVFDRAPANVGEQLEYHSLLVQSVADTKKRQAEQQSLRDWLHGELVHWQEVLTTQFVAHRDRPDLADNVEELRLVREELAAVENRLRELADAARDPERENVECELERLSGWRRFGPNWSDKLSAARHHIEQFTTAHAEYSATEVIARSEQDWLAEQATRIANMKRSRDELAATRERERAAAAASLDVMRARIDAAGDATAKINRARVDFARRYVDFDGAPSDLPELWDRLHAIESRQQDCRDRIDRARESLRQLDRRVYWRRGLMAIGIAVTLVCLFWGRGWVGWLGAFAAAGLAASLRWIYRVEPADAESRRDALVAADAAHDRVRRERDAVVEQLGPRFIVPPEREAEWRRLWPAYRRELNSLNEQAALVPNREQISQLTAERDTAETQLAEFNDETADRLADADDAIARAEAESERRERELERLQESLADHRERFFGTRDAVWPARPIAALPTAWQPVLDVAAAAQAAGAAGANSAGELIAWCQSLDDAAWHKFADTCLAVERLSSQLTPNPAAAAAHAAAVQEAEALLQSLREQSFRLTDAIAPFTGETDVSWLREQALACQSLESKIARRELELAELPIPEALAGEVERAERELADATAILGPILTQYENDPSRAWDAFKERAELLRQVREHETSAATLARESGFASLEELAHEAGKAEGLVATIRAESQQLLATSDEMWEAVDAPELATERAASLETRRNEELVELTSVERERAEIAATIRQMEADPAADEHAIQTELELLRGEQRELERRRDQLAAEFQETDRLMQELMCVERTALEGRITAYFAEFSRTPGRRVELDAELHIRLRHDDGTRCVPDQLSHGARDQLYLAVYFATTADLDLPFILDDPFVNCDAERLAAIRACWDRLIPDHQLILLSHDPHLASWAPALEMRDAA